MRYLACVLSVLAAAAGFAQEAKGPPSSCVACHSDADLFDEDALSFLAKLDNDVHANLGLSCHDCHGGNPDIRLAEDMEAAMDPSFSWNPYRGSPEKAEVPGFCGQCHSDPSYMKRFRPDARVDQEQEYWTSHHGQALRAGDTKVATCLECHGAHGIRRASATDSSVYPTRVAETCGSCHDDAELMAGYTLEDGRPLPVAQHARWRQSVHAQAMFDKEDLSAPTCNDCHGNHGATPPGLDSVNYVCGQCHGREAELFRKSPKHDGFQAHNRYLSEVGEEGCAACHEAPQALVQDVSHFSECATCHGNHGIVRPTLALFAALPDLPCAFCHEGPASPAHGAAEPESKQREYERIRDGLLADAEAAGLSPEERFNWMVDTALALPAHLLPGESPERGDAALRPEFRDLFTKFRIGKTYYSYRDPRTREEIEVRVTRCDKCHTPEPATAGDPPGATSAIAFVDRMRELTALAARAERVVLAARRGGVETRAALLDIDQAVDAQIGLEVLVHTFSLDDGSAYLEQHQKGLDHVAAALERGQGAMDELQSRRNGLAVSLLVILAVLISLGLKIRQLSQLERSREQA